MEAKPVTINNTAMPKISVIMPNCNYAQYLPSALDSLIAQTFTDWECIVIDDGSRDNSVEIIRQYMARDNRIRLIETAHVGIASARNRGLDAARGDYIAFLDSDDCYTQTALEILYTHAEMNNADITGGGVQSVFPDFKFAPLQNAAAPACTFSWFSGADAYFLNCGATQSWFWLWRRLFKREFIGDARFNESMNVIGEDTYFMLENAWRAGKIVDVHTPIVYHRGHNSSVSMRTMLPDYFAYFTNLLEMLAGAHKNYCDDLCKYIYNSIAEQILMHTVIKPKVLRAHQEEAKQTLIKCAHLIPRRYLVGWRRRIMFWYLSRLKNA